MYPLLSLIFAHDAYLTVAVPQIFYGIEMTILFFVVMTVNKAMKKTMLVMKVIATKLRYYIIFNTILMYATVVLILFLFLINVDLTLQVYSGNGFVYSNKFLLDFASVTIRYCDTIQLFVVLFVLFPISYGTAESDKKRKVTHSMKSTERTQHSQHQSDSKSSKLEMI